MRFHSPWALALLVVPGAVILWRMLRRERAREAVTFSSTLLLDGLPRTFRERLAWVPTALWFAGACLLIVALARPQEGTGSVRTTTDGVAMMLVVDRSSSMQEPMIYRGEQRARIDVVREVASRFVAGDVEELEGREGDLIGLVSFARYADTLCPLVRIHDTLLEFIDRVQTVRIRAEDGTAIGDGIALAAARLEKAEEELTERNEGEEDPDFEIKSKVIVLLTDGDENAGDITFRESSELCRELGIRLYAIGIGGGRFTDMLGRTRDIPSPAQSPAFRANAEMTGGLAIGARTGEDLLEIYRRIDELEKTTIESVEYTNYDESFTPYAASGLGVLLASWLLSWTVFRRTGGDGS